MASAVFDTDAALSPPLDLSHHFSRTAAKRTESQIKDFYRYFAIPGIGNLAGGLPNASLFPYDTLEASVALPHRFTPTPNHPEISSNALANPSSGGLASSRLLIPKFSDSEDPVRRIDLASALQYGTAKGYPPLYSFLRQFTRESLHPNVPYSGGPEIILSCGNTDGFAKSLSLVSNEWSERTNSIAERGGILVEQFAYMNAIQAAAPRGLQIIPVSMDTQGMRKDGPGGLLDVLKNWDPTKGKRPHLMYTVTIGQNPTSGTLTLSRRKELYQLCHEYDIIIIEDDPYWYLQYPSTTASKETRTEDVSAPPSGQVQTKRSSGFEFLDSLEPSYLSIDTDGRVIRLDTFSKTIAPGCRLGWITAQPEFIERIQRITEVTTQQPSGFVQAMVAELIIGSQDSDDGSRGGGKDGCGWRVDGWVRWLAGLRGAYERRMQTMCRILEDGKYLYQTSRKSDVGAAMLVDLCTGEWNVVDKVKMYDFTWPQGGMFVWLAFNFASHPLHEKAPLVKLSHAFWVHLTTKPYLVLIAPGVIFCPTPELSETKGPQYYRLCFAAVEEEEVKSISQHFVAGVHSFWAKTDSAELKYRSDFLDVDVASDG